MRVVGSLIKAGRGERGISQGKLAKMLGYTTPQYISNAERGLCSMPVKKLRKISTILGIPPGVMQTAIFTDYKNHVMKRWGK